MMSTLIVHCVWEDETARERTGHPASYTEAKIMKLLALHTHGCPRNLRDCSYSSSLCLCVNIDICNWTDKQRNLALWAFRKWKYHQFTSLRVSAVSLGKVPCIWQGMLI